MGEPAIDGVVVADTNIVIWYVLEPGKLTAAARDALETETTAGRPIGVSAWALVEIGYAAEKPSNPLTAQDRSAILAELAAPDSPFDVVPVDAEIAVRVAEVPREVNADQATGCSSPPPECWAPAWSQPIARCRR